MKKLLLAAAALSLMAAPAYAQTHTLAFEGSVAAKCHLPEVNTTYDLTTELEIGDDGYLVNGNNMGWTTVLNLSGQFGGASAWCNTATDVSVTGNRLVHESLPPTTTHSMYNNIPAGFTRTLPMQLVNFSVGGAGGVTFPTLNTGNNLDAGNAVIQSSVGPFAGPISGEFQLWNHFNRPWAGDYVATWTLTFTPS